MLVQSAHGLLCCTPALTVSCCARRTRAHSHTYALPYPRSAPRADEELAEHTRTCQRKPRHMAPPRPPQPHLPILASASTVHAGSASAVAAASPPPSPSPLLRSPPPCLEVSGSAQCFPLTRIKIYELCQMCRRDRDTVLTSFSLTHQLPSQGGGEGGEGGGGGFSYRI